MIYFKQDIHNFENTDRVTLIGSSVKHHFLSFKPFLSSRFDFSTLKTMNVCVIIIYSISEIKTFCDVIHPLEAQLGEWGISNELSEVNM